MEKTMKTMIPLLAALLSLQLCMAVSVMAQSDADKAASCSTYARNRAESEGGAGRSSLRHGVRGAAGGALFGAIIDGGEGAGKGAALGGGLGLLGGAIRGSQDRESRYRYYYDACMRGNM